MTSQQGIFRTTNMIWFLNGRGEKDLRKIHTHRTNIHDRKISPNLCLISTRNL